MMTRKRLLTLIAALALAACQSPAAPAATPSKLKAVAAETFLADIAQNVAGDRVKIEALMPIGVDPHGFEPTPADAAKVADSDLLIVNGAGFEAFLAELLHNAGGQRTVIEAAAGLASREAREGEEAVMSEAEKAEALCAELAELEAVSELAAPTAAESAAAHEKKHQAHEAEASATAQPDEHAHENEQVHAGLSLLDLKLAAQGGRHGGFFTIHPHEHGDYQVGTPAGIVVLRSLDGAQTFEAEETLSMACGGLTQGQVFELEEGEYTLELSGFTAETMPLLLGAAGGHHHHEGDPHFWLDPNNVIKYAENIRDGLSKADPDSAAAYAANADKYIQQLKTLDQSIRDQVAAIPEARRLIVTNHESFGYFADRYGFKIIGTVVPSVSTGSAPSAQQLARLIDHIKATGAAAIFLETGANPQLAQQVANETGIQVVTELYSHSITDANGPAPTYLDMMRANVAAMVAALK